MTGEIGAQVPDGLPRDACPVELGLPGPWVQENQTGAVGRLALTPTTPPAVVGFTLSSHVLGYARLTATVQR